MLDSALEYAMSGFHIFPLVPYWKTPATNHGFQDATINESQIREWWRKDSEYNIGIRCGYKFKVICLDIDKKKDKNGFLWLNSQQSLPITPEQTTPSTGKQYLFKPPEEFIPCSTDKIALGVDIRGEGGYFVAPPSFLRARPPSENYVGYPYEGPYEWVTEQSIFDLPLAGMPEFLLAAIREFTQPPEPEREKNEFGPSVISISSVMSKYNVRLKMVKPGVFQGAHPLHGSTNGMNFRVDTTRNSWACWRHTKPNGSPVGGGPLQLIALMEGILLCTECVRGSLKGEKFDRLMSIAREKFGIPKYKFFLNNFEFEVKPPNGKQ